MTTFVEFLAALPALKLDKLYNSPWTCQAVLRSLPPVAKQYVLRLLFLDAPVPESLLADWCLASALSKHQAALSRLQQLRVLLSARPEVGQGPSQFRLNPPFQKQLLAAVVSGSSAAQSQVRAPASSKGVPEAELDAYARAQWEAVLLHLTAGTDKALGAGLTSQGGSRGRQSPLVKSIFRRAGLLPPNGAQPPQGTVPDSAGRFGFLLKDSSEQLWLVISHYVAVCEEERGMDSADLLTFLLELGFHTPGQRYSVSQLTPQQQSVVEDLSVLGLVLLQKGSKDRYFVPTSLAAGLSASLSQTQGPGSAKGFVIVETNFKVYAHTGSQFQTELLSLFLRPECCLPNLVIGEINRETAMKAFDAGITADQIVQYMRKHAHPQVASRVPVVPETVTDQIRLWEHDRNRVAYVPAVYYEDFPSQEAFEAVVSHARDLNGLLWEDPKARKLVADESCHESLRNFIRKLALPKKKP